MNHMQKELIFPWLLAQRSLHTRRAYERIASTYIENIHPKSILEAKPLDVAKFFDSVQHEVGVASYNQMRSAIASLYDFLIRVGQVSNNPVSAFKTKSNSNHNLKFIPDEKIYWRVVEVEVNLRNRLMLHFAFALGLRLFEILNVSAKDFEKGFQGELILKVYGKGARVREVVVPGWLSDIIFEYVRLNEISGQEKIFHSPANKLESLSDSQAYRIFISASKRAGLSRPIGPHKYRHGHATEAVLKGASLKALKDEMGHSSLSTLQRYIEQAQLQAPSLLFRPSETIAIAPPALERDVTDGRP